MKILDGVVHEVPKDLKEMIATSSKVHDLWNNLTPLARNEWICWIISDKKPETRKDHIERACVEIINGKKRPCCWAGCPHRKK